MAHATNSDGRHDGQTHTLLLVGQAGPAPGGRHDMKWGPAEKTSLDQGTIAQGKNSPRTLSVQMGHWTAGSKL